MLRNREDFTVTDPNMPDDGAPPDWLAEAAKAGLSRERARFAELFDAQDDSLELLRRRWVELGKLADEIEAIRRVLDEGGP